MAQDMVHPSKPTMFCMVVTPMDEQRRIDEEACRAHLRRMIDGGIGVYLGSGGTGQGHALEREELQRLYEIGVSECKGKVPVYCNPPEARTAKEMLWKARLGADAGMDVVQLYQLDAGHGRTPPLWEQEHYFRDLLEEIDHPIALSVHQASGYLAPVALTAQLCNDYPQVVAVNLHGPGMPYLLQLKERIRDNIKIYTGMVNVLTSLPLGGWGCQAAEPNLVPKLCQSVIDHFLSGDIGKMGAAYAQVLQVWSALAPAQAQSQDATKAVLRAMGLPGGYTRPPRAPVDEAALAQVLENLKALHIPEIEGLTG